MHIYYWIKAFHIIAAVSWFAGLFYIFRLFVYHVKHKENQSIAEVYTEMESKLLKIIMNPAMFLTIFFGLMLIHLNPDLMKQPWLHIKLTAIFVLIIYHFFSYKTCLRFKNKDYFLTEKACRLINEVPTLLLFIIVIMASVRPFL